MNKAVISKIAYSLAVVLFGAMCATLSYNYASMECAIAHGGASAPASVVFLYAIPFIVLIALCLVIGKVLKEKK